MSCRRKKPPSSVMSAPPPGRVFNPFSKNWQNSSLRDRFFFFSLSHLRLKVKWLRPAQASPSGLATPHFPSVSHERQEARQRGPVPFQADPYDSRVTGRKFGLPSMDPFLANDIGQHRASEEAGSLHRVPQELVIFFPFFRLFLPPLSPCLSGSCSSSGSHGPVLQIA